MERIWLKNYPKGVPADIDPTQYASIIDVFNDACKQFGPQPAFTNLGVTLTFDQLHKMVDNMASFYQNELKLKKGDRIAVQMPNLLQFPVAVFAALKVGLVVVNTNPLYTAKEMEHQFKDSGAKAIVILANYGALLEQIIRQTSIESVVVTEIGDLFPFPKSLLVNSVVKYVKKMVPKFHLPQAYTMREALQIGSMKPASAVEVKSSDIAFLQYTGGTTGVSKGAMLSNRNVVANMLQILNWISPFLEKGKEIAVAALPMYHIFSLTANCLAFMSFGTHNVLITNPRDIPAFIKELNKYPFTLMTGVNTLFNALMNHADFEKANLKHMKVSVAGAMALQRAVSERWKKLTGSVIVEGYGLTEASPVICVNPLGGTDRVGTIGMPVPSTEVRLEDDNGKEVEIGGIGELLAKGPQVMLGYWNRPDETEKVIDKNGWLHTGDIATVDETGFFKIVDRKKDMIIVSGFNVYPNEVEDALANHPGILEAAAIGVPDGHSGEVVKVVVVKKDPNLTAEDVIKHAKASLTNYKVPKLVEFRTELPKTNVGKILRRALRDQPPTT
ncbi:MAG: AMP-binding protein [Bdellovibrionota bacterium]